MEIKITTKQILIVLQVISWIIFIGLCIEAGGAIFNALFPGFFNPNESGHFVLTGLDLSELYNFDKGQFLVIAFSMIIVALLKAILFYLIIKVLHQNKLNMSHPFTTEFRKFISLMAYISLGIGLFSYCGINYSEWLTSQGITMPDGESLRLGGDDVWFFMGVILLVISQIFKRGIEIQNDNELTI